MGDQIYADDVADPIFPVIRRLSKELIGHEENLGAIEPKLTNLPFQGNIDKINGRQYIAEQFGGFTSNNADNHLLSFGEFAAMYLLSWSPEVWRAAQDENLFLSFSEVMEKNKVHFTFPEHEEYEKENNIEINQLKERYQNQEVLLSTFRESLYAVRRVMANTPTYMIFDDHDITDDWNLTEEWKTRVYDSPLGRHVISNGLTAYWLFQGWGNEPETFSRFDQPVQSYFENMTPKSHSIWMDSMWSYSSWHFLAPTAPAALFLDTRTQREYIDDPQPLKIGRKIDEVKYSPNLINNTEWDALTLKLKNAQWNSGDPLILISPTPLYGIGLIENFLQKYMLPLRSIGVPVQQTFDLEAWKYNEKGFTEFLWRVAGWNPSHCFILSGDVHSASAVKSMITLPDQSKFSIQQFTSSPIKNVSYSTITGTLMKFLISLNARQRTDRILFRYCTHDFHLVTTTDGKKVPDEFEWKERIEYLKVKDSSIFETENNIGLFTYTPKEAHHTLLLSNKNHNFTWSEKLAPPE